MKSTRWNIFSNITPANSQEIIEILANNRSIENINEFIAPPQPESYVSHYEKEISLAVKLIKEAIKQDKPIIIHGDYDADGQTATAILWRTIHNDLNHVKTFPYIPNRFDEGYGLSVNSINGIKAMLAEKGLDYKGALLVTVDCGIVSEKEVDQAKSEGFIVTVTDHHQPHESYPKADCVVWTDKSTGAGIAWMISYKLLERSKYLDLAAIGTICDLQPLTDFNRSVAKYGIEELNKNPVPGIKAIAEISALKAQIDTYEIGWIIGPKLNATGRLETAMDSLRLLCTDSMQQARQMAGKLNDLNRRRQEQTESNYKTAAIQFYKMKTIPTFLVSSDKSYHEGVIGLVAGKLTQTFYRPSIAISINSEEKIAKGSARSIKGISIIETLRKFEHLFINVGGHDMAAGFSIKEENIQTLSEKLSQLADWDEGIFEKQIDVDCELPTNLISMDTYNATHQLKPFGIGNPEPTFLTKNLTISNFNSFGKENSHHKLFLQDEDGKQYTAIAFSRPDFVDYLTIGAEIDAVYSLSEDTWNGKSSLQLRLRDIKVI